MKQTQRKLSNQYLSTFCLEIMLLLSAGLTPYESILAMYEDEPDKDGRDILHSLFGSLENGAPISAAFRESGLFPAYMENLTEAGEKTGRLVETMKALSDYYDRLDRLSLALQNAVLYPLTVFVMMSAAVTMLVVKVLPVFNDVFGRIGAQMPPLAVRLMHFGRWVGGASAFIAAAAGVLTVAALIIWMTPSARSAAAKKLKNTFGGHGVLCRISDSRFVSVMALAAASGIDPVEAADLAAFTAGDSERRFGRCVELIREGGSLSDAMFGAGIISAQHARLLSVGARSGNSDAALAEIAARQERSVSDELERLVGKIEPAIVIITSVMVGVILLSVMLPLMSIMTAIG